MLIINQYDSVGTKKVKNNISIPEWIELIKSSKYIPQILDARQYAKTDPEYIKVKTSLPCVTYNFLFDKIKTNATISSNTGLMMIDVDVPSFDINTVDLTKIHLYNRSFGGKGYTLVVRVEGLLLNNFNTTYYSICKNLGLTLLQDKCAKKASQFTVLSYDPDIYYNPDSFIFESIEPFIQNSPPSVVIKKDQTYTTHWGEKDKGVKYTNKHDFQIEGNYVVNWITPYDVIECFMPMNKLKDGRKMSLIAYCSNLVYLNGWLPMDNVLSILTNVNNIICDVPLDRGTLTSIVKSIIQQRDENRLIPIITKRYILFNKDSGLSKEDKLEICRNEIAKKRTMDSQLKLNVIIEEWDFVKYGKITQSKVYNNFPISSKTVEKYWSEFKDLVKDLNLQYKGLQPSQLLIKDLPVGHVALQHDTIVEHSFNFEGEKYQLDNWIPFQKLINTNLSVEELYEEIHDAFDYKIKKAFGISFIKRYDINKDLFRVSICA